MSLHLEILILSVAPLRYIHKHERVMHMLDSELSTLCIVVG